MPDYPICTNPQCKSHGQPHPNCRCHANMAAGGEVSSFCSKEQPHDESCQYFAGGGEALPEGAIPVDQFQSQEDAYGGLGQQAVAGVEGLAKGLAGPLATLVEKKLGVPFKDIKTREEENPLTHMAGEATGLIAPALAGPIGEFTQAGVLGAVGHVATESLGLTGAKAVAIKLGIENALYSLGDEVSKSINGSPDSIQTAAMKVGLSGILGGVGGYGLGKVGELWASKLGPKAEQFTSDFVSRLKESEYGGIDPFTKEPRMAPEGFTPPEAQSNLDPFTKEPMEAPEAPKSPGMRDADKLVNHVLNAASEAIADGIGAAAGRLSGLPFGGTLGAMFGHHGLKPLVRTILPSIIKPLLESEASGVGLRAAFESINAVMKGEALANDATKALFEVGSSHALDYLNPDKDKIEKLNTRIEELARTPEDMMGVGGDMGYYLPGHQTALAMTAQGALNYLGAVKPKGKQLGPLDRMIPPSVEQMNDYNRTLQIAQQPLVVLGFMKKGTLKPKDVQDLKQLYPALYPSLSGKIHNQLIDHMSKKGVVPFKLRRGMSLFLGQPLDSTMAQPAILAAQMTYAPINAPMPQGATATAKGGKAMDKTTKLARTPSEARIEALNKA